MSKAEKIEALESDLRAARRERDELWTKREALRSVLGDLLGVQAQAPGGSESQGLPGEGLLKMQPLAPRQADKLRDAFRGTRGIS